MIIFTMRRNLVIVLLACLSIMTWHFASQESTMSVSVHGVDYSGNEFSYYIMDPENPERPTGADHIAPFSAGGVTCCAKLPGKWQPGIQLKINTISWLSKLEPDDPLPEIHEAHLVDVPRYVNSKPEELWVLREGSEKISVVSSNFQPDHPNWPGKIKGWPVPSLEYRRKIWKIHREQAAGNVKLYEELLRKLDEDPALSASEDWSYTKVHDAESLSEFKDSDDPAYLTHLRKEYNEGLVRSNDRLKHVMELEP